MVVGNLNNGILIPLTDIIYYHEESQQPYSIDHDNISAVNETLYTNVNIYQTSIL